MGHTGLARLCLVRWYYRTRTNLAEDGKPPPVEAGEDVTEGVNGFTDDYIEIMENRIDEVPA